jgi:hypothetical protein
MNDLTPIQQIIAPVSDRLCGDDLIAGPRTIKFTEVRAIEGDRGKKQFSIRFEGDNGRPWIPCKTMARAMVLAQQMVGRSVTVFRDPDVDFGKEKGIGGVRISHMSHLPKAAQMKLTVSQGKKGAFVFQPLTAEVAPIRTARQTAEQWAAEHIGAVQVAATLDSLSDLMAKGSKPMGKLETDKPDLWQEVSAAYAARRAQLEQPAADEGFGDFADGEEG